ncbi:MAG: hypothetical protein ACFFG0_55330 [Candidatus Thorarchaeota archaeon]
MSIDRIPVPARKIAAKERGNRGYIYTEKVNGGVAEYESCLERDRYLVLIHAPDVIKFQPQPKTIFYTDD